MSKDAKYPASVPEQQQHELPGKEHLMDPEPCYMAKWYKGSGKLQGKVALITGGDSGIGRAVSILFAREGAKVAISYLPSEQKDAQLTADIIKQEGSECLLLPGDIRDRKWCYDLVEKTFQEFKRIDILVNNAARQEVQEDFLNISDEQLENTFKTNIFSMFYISKAALKYMKEGSTIINTTSVTSFQGNPKLVDYASTKGAITAFTRSLALNLASKKIRVNGVAPGPIWTPLIPASFPKEKVGEFGKNVPLGRPGQPEEVAPSYVFLASQDSSYFTGQILHPNGGKIVNA